MFSLARCSGVATYRLRVSGIVIGVNGVIMVVSVFDIILFVIVIVMLPVLFVLFFVLVGILLGMIILSLVAQSIGSDTLTSAVIRRNQDLDDGWFLS